MTPSETLMTTLSVIEGETLTKGSFVITTAQIRGIMETAQAVLVSRKEETVTRLAQPVQISITRNAKMQIQYEVNIHGESVEDTLRMVYEAEKALSEKYPRSE